MSIEDMLEKLSPVALNMVTDALAHVATQRTKALQEEAARRMLAAVAVDLAADQAFHVETDVVRKTRGKT